MAKKNPNPLKGRAPAKRRRKPARVPKPAAVEPAVVEAAMPAEPHILTEDVVLGALGLVELKLTAAEEAVLSRPIDPGEILIKPSGQPYLSHPTYTRWFNEAFGRLGWSLVPRSKPQQEGDAVVQGYVLYIHGKPVAFAWGEQPYKPGGNKDQTYGDALEATVASALRRCAKRLGVGLEMWDKGYLARWQDEHAIMVSVERKDWRTGKMETKREWRRKIDPPLRGELRGRRRLDEDGERHEERTEQAERRPARQQPAQAPPDEDDIPLEDDRPAQTTAPAKPEQRRHHNPAGGDVITPGQLTRLHTIVTNSGRNPEAVKTWLFTRYGIGSSREILRRDYDSIIRAIESPGSLPLKGR